MNSGQSAKDIAQRVLDQSGQGLLTGDFEIFSDCFLLPQEVETFEGRRKLNTKEEMRTVFEGVRAHLEKMGVTEMVRHVVTADFRDDQTISSIHQTRLVSGTNLVQKPYNAFSVLNLENGIWRVRHSQYAVDDSPSLCRALVGEQSEATA